MGPGLLFCWMLLAASPGLFDLYASVYGVYSGVVVGGAARRRGSL